MLENTLAKEICSIFYYSNVISSLFFCIYCFGSSTITIKTSPNSIKVGVYHALAKDNERERKVLNYKYDMTKPSSLKALWSFQFSNSLHDIICNALLSDQTSFYVESFSRNLFYLIKTEMSKVLVIFLITLHTHHRSWKAQDSAALPTLWPLHSSYFL